MKLERIIENIEAVATQQHLEELDNLEAHIHVYHPSE